MKAENTTELYVPMFTAAVGLPYDLEVLAKYGYMQDANIYGAGLRYLILESKDLVIPAITVQSSRCNSLHRCRLGYDKS